MPIEPAASASTRAARIACLALVALAVAVYASALAYPFQLDDYANILSNRTFDSWNPLAWRLPENPRRAVAVGLALTRHLAGADPAWFRLANIAIHAANGALAFLLVRQALLAPRAPERLRGAATGIALVAAAIFVAHPLATESVTYVVQRCESQMTLCFLLCLYAVGRRAAEPARGRAWALIALAAAVVGASSKEPMAMVVLIAPLYLRAFFCASWSEVARAHGHVLLGIVALAGAVIVSDLGAHHAPRAAWVAASYFQWTPWSYLTTQAEVIPHYLRLALWPSGQCFDYLWAPTTGHGWLLPGAALAAVFIVAAVGGLRGRAWAFPILACYLILAPTSSFLPVLDAAVEHRMYLPVLALAAGAAAALAAALPMWRKALAVAGAIAVIALAAAAWQRDRVYRSHESLWTDTVTKRPDNVRARYNLAMAYQEQHRDAEAVAELEQALAIRPGYSQARVMLATHRLAVGDLAGARACLEAGIAANPQDAHALAMLGQVHAAAGDDAGAAPLLGRALALDPRDGMALTGQAFLRYRAGDLAGAETLARVVAADPYAEDAANARTLLGMLALRARLPADAERELREALRLRPDQSDALALLAGILIDGGRGDEAARLIAAAPPEARQAPAVRAVAARMPPAP